MLGWQGVEDASHWIGVRFVLYQPWLLRCLPEIHLLTGGLKVCGTVDDKAGGGSEQTVA